MTAAPYLGGSGALALALSISPSLSLSLSNRRIWVAAARCGRRIILLCGVHGLQGALELFAVVCGKQPWNCWRLCGCSFAGRSRGRVPEAGVAASRWTEAFACGWRPQLAMQFPVAGARTRYAMVTGPCDGDGAQLGARICLSVCLSASLSPPPLSLSLSFSPSLSLCLRAAGVAWSPGGSSPCTVCGSRGREAVALLRRRD